MTNNVAFLFLMVSSIEADLPIGNWPPEPDRISMWLFYSLQFYHNRLVLTFSNKVRCHCLKIKEQVCYLIIYVQMLNIVGRFYF